MISLSDKLIERARVDFLEKKNVHCIGIFVDDRIRKNVHCMGVHCIGIKLYSDDHLDAVQKHRI